MENVNLVAVVVTVVTSAGFGAVIKSIVDGIVMHRSGVSGREDRRRTDIIAQRDHADLLRKEAEAGERAADARADGERVRRIAWMEHAAKQRWRLAENGIDPGPLPDDLESTDNPLNRRPPT